MKKNQQELHSTTILAVRSPKSIAIGGDGQVTLGQTALKHDARKIRTLAGGRVLCGFAGSAADGLALLERLETKLESYNANLRRAAIELAKDWRTDRLLRRLDALLIGCSRDALLMISGSGDVIEPSDGVIGIGSGGVFAASAAKALIRHTDLNPSQVVESALKIAAEVCIYSNDHLTIESLDITPVGG